MDIKDCIVGLCEGMVETNKTCLEIAKHLGQTNRRVKFLTIAAGVCIWCLHKKQKVQEAEMLKLKEKIEELQTPKEA